MKSSERSRKLRVNVVVNVGSKIWASCASFIFIPFYLGLLGPEAYGLVGFFMALLGMTFLFDMGLSLSLTREMAAYNVNRRSRKSLGEIFLSYEVVLVLIALLPFLCIAALSGFLAGSWLKIQSLDPLVVQNSIVLMGASVSFQLLNALYFGAFMGVEKQVQANLVSTLFTLLRGVLTIVALEQFGSSLTVFFWVQFVISATNAFVYRIGIYLVLSKIGGPFRFRFATVQRSLRYIAGLASASIVAFFQTQLDKFLISSMLGLKELGQYTVAILLAQIPILLATPVAQAYFPRLTSAISSGDTSEYKRVSDSLMYLVFILVVPLGAFIFSNSGLIVFAWTGNGIVASEIDLVLKVLSIAWLLQALTVPIYNISLANKNTKINLLIGVISTILLVPVMLIGIGPFGVLAVASTWLLVNLLTFFPYTALVHRRFVGDDYGFWLGRIVLLCALNYPFSIAVNFFLSRQFEGRLSVSVYLLTSLILLYALNVVVGFSDLKKAFGQVTKIRIPT